MAGRKVQIYFQPSRADKAFLVKTLRRRSLEQEVHRRADILCRLAKGETPIEIHKALGNPTSGIRGIRTRALEFGVKETVFGRKAPGAKRQTTEKQEAEIVALCCSQPPPGEARWTIRLLTEEVRECKIDPSMTRERVRVILERHELKPWREKNVVRGGDNS